MQTLDNSMRLRPRPRRPAAACVLQTEQDPDNPNPTCIPVANRAAERLAEQIGGIAQSDIDRGAAQHPGDRAHPRRRGDRRDGPSTASSTATSASFGYENLLVCDGSAVPANVGVNPSLTITALAEHAMACDTAEGDE